MSANRFVLWLFLVVCVLFMGCAPQANPPAVIIVPLQTQTLAAIPSLTETITLTVTSTPIPTTTLTPTQTATLTATPVPAMGQGEAILTYRKTVCG